MCMSCCTKLLRICSLSLQLLFLVHHGRIYNYLDTRSKFSQGLFSSVNVCIPVAHMYTIVVAQWEPSTYSLYGRLFSTSKKHKQKNWKLHLFYPIIIIPGLNVFVKLSCFSKWMSIVYHLVVIQNSYWDLMIENIFQLQAKWIYWLHDLSTCTWSCYWSLVWGLAYATWLG